MKRFSCATTALKTVFGYDQFRGFQKEAIDCVLSGKDALVLMPTGGGKSLCYQIPALLQAGLTVVVSPLIALMQDQVDALEELGVKAAFMNSTQTQDDYEAVRDRILAGDLDILYVAPERLLLPGMQALLLRVGVSLFAIDEAHCVSEWGHDFRPEYGALGGLREAFPHVPRLAVTASADARTKEEIIEKLLVDPECFIASFDRPNLFYRVLEKKNFKHQLLDFIKTEHLGDCGIVYCLSRRKADELAEYLVDNGIRALPYHAGHTPETRAKHQALFLREEGIVMVATIAFGMGIDKPNVRFVVHADLPKSPESYMQEVGRAGRDGELADAWMAFGLSDVSGRFFFAEQGDASEHYKAVERRKISEMLAIADTTGCRRQALLRYFGEDCEPCRHCDNCLAPPKVVDALREAKMLVSAVYRLEEKSGYGFGATQVIDVLMGKATKKVKDLGHDQVSTFGIGSHWDATRWRRLVRKLIGLEVLTVDAATMSLRLTGKTNALLRDELPVTIRASRNETTLREEKRQMDTTSLNSEDRRLYESLRQWRGVVARIGKKQPYMIFTNQTLAEIAQTRPETLTALSTINGVGAKKLENYGDEVLRLVREDALEP